MCWGNTVEWGGRAGAGCCSEDWALDSWKEVGRCGPELPIDPAGDDCWGLETLFIHYFNMECENVLVFFTINGHQEIYDKPLFLKNPTIKRKRVTQIDVWLSLQNVIMTNYAL